jgi:hypothetical protein
MTTNLAIYVGSEQMPRNSTFFDIGRVYKIIDKHLTLDMYLLDNHKMCTFEELKIIPFINLNRRK